MFPLAVLMTCTAGAAFLTALLGGWLLATRLDWIRDDDRAPPSTIVPFALAAITTLICVVIARDPAFWSTP